MTWSTEFFSKVAAVVGVLIFGSFAVLWVRWAMRFDDAIRQLKERDAKRWCELGRPTGFFWSPEKADRGRFREATLSRDELAQLYRRDFKEFLRVVGNKGDSPSD